MSVRHTPILEDERRIIEVAREIDALAELCDFVDYYTDKGSVPEHWRAKWYVLNLVRSLNGAKQA